MLKQRWSTTLYIVATLRHPLAWGLSDTAPPAERYPSHDARNVLRDEGHIPSTWAFKVSVLCPTHHGHLNFFLTGPGETQRWSKSKGKAPTSHWLLLHLDMSSSDSSNQMQEYQALSCTLLVGSSKKSHQITNKNTRSAWVL